MQGERGLRAEAGSYDQYGRCGGRLDRGRRFKNHAVLTQARRYRLVAREDSRACPVRDDYEQTHVRTYQAQVPQVL